MNTNLNIYSCCKHTSVYWKCNFPFTAHSDMHSPSICDHDTPNLKFHSVTIHSTSYWLYFTSSPPCPSTLIPQLQRNMGKMSVIVSNINTQFIIMKYKHNFETVRFWVKIKFNDLKNPIKPYLITMKHKHINYLN